MVQTGYFYPHLCMKKTILCLLTLLPLLAFSQSYLGRAKQDILKEASAGSLYSFTEKNGMLERHEQNEQAKSWVMVLGFDSAGHCNAEKHYTRCGDCQRYALSSVLRKKKYRWKSINNNQYLSKFAAGLLLEVQFYDEKYFITYLPSGLDLATYQSITKRKK